MIGYFNIMRSFDFFEEGFDDNNLITESQLYICGLLFAYKNIFDQINNNKSYALGIRIVIDDSHDNKGLLSVMKYLNSFWDKDTHQFMKVEHIVKLINHVGSKVKDFSCEMVKYLSKHITFVPKTIEASRDIFGNINLSEELMNTKQYYVKKDGENKSKKI